MSFPRPEGAHQVAPPLLCSLAGDRGKDSSHEKGVQTERFAGVQDLPPPSCPAEEQQPGWERTPVFRTELLSPQKNCRLHDYYDLGRKLGAGAFGDIYEAVAKASSKRTVAAASGTRVAVKCFHFAAGQNNSQDMLLSFQREVAILASLDHPHILRMHESFREGDVGHLALELCGGGDLFTRITALSAGGTAGGMAESLTREYFRQMLDAVGYLHARRIVHMDLKTENFLLLGEPGSPLERVLKLCDFGTCELLTFDNPRSHGRAGSPSYTAPELYMGRGADVAADMWSLGVVLYVLITGTNPFKGPLTGSSEDAIQKICTACFEQRRSNWVRCSETAQDLVRRLLVVDEQRRSSCAQASVHRWMASSERPLLAAGIADPPGIERQAPTLWARLQRMVTLPATHRAALVVCVLATSSEELESCRELFIALDRDKDGQLSFDEFERGLRSLLREAAKRDGSPMPKAEDDHLMRACIAALDVDGSGLIEWPEFAATALLAEGAGIGNRVLSGERLALAVRLAAKCPSTLGLGAGGRADPHLPWLAPIMHAIAGAARIDAQEETIVSAPPDALGLVVSQLDNKVLLVGATDPGRLTLQATSKVGVPFLGCAAVKGWNEVCLAGGMAHMMLSCDDCIVQIGGARGDAEQMMSILLQAVKNCDMDVDLRTVNLKKVEVALPRAYPGQNLGLHVRKKNTTAFGLVVEGVDPIGIVKDWNDGNERCRVKPGDVIVAVSGLRGLRQDLLQEVARKDRDMIHLTVLDLSIFCL